MEYILFISLTALAIAAQVPNAYYVFKTFSRLEGNLKEIQAIAFCLILSVAIFGFVYIEKPQLALLEAFLEMIINVYYYTSSFWKNGFNKRENAQRSIKQQITKFWRINWIAIILMGFCMPMFVYVFSEILVNL